MEHMGYCADIISQDIPIKSNQDMDMKHPVTDVSITFDQHLRFRTN